MGAFVAASEDKISVFDGDIERLPSDAFVAKVGERVRIAREAKGLTRKKLSELSKISQRYLAHLEGGEGNISIALLHRVATALNRRVEWFVVEQDPSDASRIAALYSAATVSQRQKILQILNPEPPADMRARRICLIGLRGAGKTTLGRMLGENLDIPFVELNREIEEQSGMPVNEVMALYGQEGYRRLERQALDRIVATRDCLALAAAGGIVSEPETFHFLLGRFHTIWLKAAPEEHMQRVRAQGDDRPMAGNPKAMEELNAILKSREALYARAEITVDTSGRTVAETADELLRAVQGLGVL
jgi:XRE family aerobic/anaerobic benzoate catabolism transcriptional regulator